MVLAIALEWLLFSLSALLGFAAWLVYLWAVRDGQFKDIESSAEKVLAAPASVSVVDVRDIQERTSVTVTDHVRGVPGVDVNQGGIAQSLSLIHISEPTRPY